MLCSQIFALGLYYYVKLTSQLCSLLQFVGDFLSSLDW